MKDPFAANRPAGAQVPGNRAAGPPWGMATAPPAASPPVAVYPPSSGWNPHGTSAPAMHSAALPPAGSMGQIGRDSSLGNLEAAAGAMDGGARRNSGGTFRPTASHAPSESQANAFPDFASNPMAAFAMQSGKQVLESSLARYLPGAHALWRSMRFYFQVNNQYVKTKLQRLFFPFRHRDWARTQAPDASNNEEMAYNPPVRDSNSLDLYIPLMAFVTYVLATGLLKGIGMKFHPEVLSQVMSSCVVLTILEVAIVRACLYTLNVSGIGMLDLIALSGYKYVGLVVNSFVGLALGTLAYYVCLLYTGGCMVYFTMNTLFPLLRPDFHGGSPSVGNGSQRNTSIIAIAGLQLLIMWWLGPASDLSLAAPSAAAVPVL